MRQLFIGIVQDNPRTTLLRQGSQKDQSLVGFGKFKTFDVDTGIDQLRHSFELKQFGLNLSNDLRNRLTGDGAYWQVDS